MRMARRTSGGQSGAWAIFTGSLGNFTRDPNRCQPEKSLATIHRSRRGRPSTDCRLEVLVTVRVALVSQLYANPANRAKLKALAALGVDLTAIVPEHWRAQDDTIQNTVSGNDNGVQVVTVPVRSYPGRPSNPLWNPKELRRALAD